MVLLYIGSWDRHRGWKAENSPGKSVNKLTLPARTKVIVKLPVTEGSPVKEGLIERAEVLAEVYLAESCQGRQGPRNY